MMYVYNLVNMKYIIQYYIREKYTIYEVILSDKKK
jgi:hypothetical protein